jgi:hypothetical protein
MATTSNQPMKHGIKWIAVTAICALTGSCGWFGGDESARLAAAAGENWKMLGRFCMDCHNASEYTANLAFDRMSPEEVADHPEIFEKVIRKLRGGLMPPPGEPRPDEDTLYTFVTWLENTIDAAAEPYSPHVALHRLNRKEYANAIRDLLALEVDAIDLLPQDDRFAGFDNIADALQVSPSFIEQYIAAARSVAVQAIGQPAARPSSQTYEAKPRTQFNHIDGLPLGTRGGILAEHYFPSDGEYEINIANMARALWVDNMQFRNTLVVTLDSQPIYTTTIGGEEDLKAVDQLQDPAIDAINARLKNIRFAATAGPHKVGVAFIRRNAAESEERLQAFIAGGGQSNVFRVGSFQIAGPYSPTGVSPTPSREKIFTCYPSREQDQLPCAEEILSSIGTRAFRRPLKETDMSDILRYYETGLERGGFEEGIRSALTSILASPYFLYRTELNQQDVITGDLEFASRLSFFLWNSIPDDELRGLAIRGELSDETVRRQQVERMLADPRAETLGSNFAFQWLDFGRLDEVAPDPVIFPYASGRADPRDDYVTEATMFVNSIFQADRSVTDLMTARHTYLNERLALLYGITNVKGDRFRRVELEDSVRWGLLGKGAVLMGSSYPNRTSPVLRGAYLLEHILGAPPTPPPLNVPAFPEKDVGTLQARTVREIMAQHRTNPVCASCHDVIDSLGFTLENFDGVGVWRDKDRFAGEIIDATGSLTNGTVLTGPDSLRNELMTRPEQFVQTFTEQLFTYALGRVLEYSDMPTVRKIVRDSAQDDYRFSSIIMGIVESDQFRAVSAVDDSDKDAQELTAQNLEE